MNGLNSFQHQNPLIVELIFPIGLILNLKCYFFNNKQLFKKFEIISTTVICLKNVLAYILNIKTDLKDAAFVII